MKDKAGAMSAEARATKAALDDVSAAGARAGRAIAAAMKPAKDAIDDVEKRATGLSLSLSDSLGGALKGLIYDGAGLSDTLRGLALEMSKSVFSAAMAPVQKAAGGFVASLLGGMFADGAAFSSGRVRAFASGGVVGGPTAFPMRGGMGLMGEAGPEAILPLSRGPDGKLGVRAGAGGGVAVTVNIATQDVEGFRRSSGQISAQLARAVARGTRHL